MNKIVTINKLNHQGEGIGLINKKIVFIPKTIPGDKVKVEIIKEHKSYYEARVISFIERSKDNIDYSCPYYDKCNGCQIANLGYGQQLLFKKEKVENILEKYCHLKRDIKIEASSKNINYRNKATFKINKYLSFYDVDNKLIRIDKCLLLKDKMNSTINELNKTNLDKIKEVVIRENNNELMVIFDNKVVFGKNKLIENINNFEFIISPDSFFQINKEITEKLYKKISEYASLTKKDRILDLYCGTGTIGIYLSKECDYVLGIEINEDSIKDARENKKINNINNIDFIKGEVSSILKDNIDFDVVIVDPPRGGLDKKTRNLLQEGRFKKIIYVSCEPMTLARDINDLDKYSLKEITLFDMFPNTYHVETVVLITKKND